MNEERNREIARLYAEEPGMSLQSVGDLFGLTRERVRQILNRQGITYRHPRTRDRLCRRCGRPLARLVAGRRVQSRYHPACLIEQREANRERTRQEMIEQVQEFARVHGRTPGGVDFNPALRNVSEERKQEALACRAVTPLPFASWVQSMFGSTSALIEASGLAPAEIGGAAFLAGRKRRGEA